jgi:hypothetical protein
MLSERVDAPKAEIHLNTWAHEYHHEGSPSLIKLPFQSIHISIDVSSKFWREWAVLSAGLRILERESAAQRWLGETSEKDRKRQSLLCPICLILSNSLRERRKWEGTGRGGVQSSRKVVANSGRWQMQSTLGSTSCLASSRLKANFIILSSYHYGEEWTIFLSISLEQWGLGMWQLCRPLSSTCHQIIPSSASISQLFRL